MIRRNHTQTRWITTLAAAASIAVATSGFAQTVPPAQPAPDVNKGMAKQHLTAARNALSELTQLPAAAQLTGEARTQVQQLISNFNELITKDTEWRASYAKVESNLAVLLGAEAPAAASGTPGAVGTSGSAGIAKALDPAIRAKLTELRTHLDRFEAVVDTPPSPAAATPDTAAATTPPPATPPPATPPPATPPATTPPPATSASVAAGSVDPKTEATPDSPPAPQAAVNPDRQVTVVAKDLLNHVEAVEVILGAQVAAQKRATTAAGGAVTSSATPSGSTKTTLSGADVTLNPSQLEQINTHLKELRRLLERK